MTGKPTKPEKNSTLEKLDDINGVLQDLFILQLGKAGVPQQEIRKLLGVDIVKVNRIVSKLKGGKKRKENVKKKTRSKSIKKTK